MTSILTWLNVATLLAIALVLVYVIRLARQQKRALRTLARSMHAPVMDVACYYMQLDADRASSFVRANVDDHARAIMIGELGAAYDDWLRRLYERAQAAIAAKSAQR